MADDKKKKPDLESLANELLPERIAEKINVPHNQAREDYTLKKVQISDYNSFRDELVKYMKHHHKKAYKSELSDERAFGMVHKILDSDHQHGGFEGAFKKAQLGQMNEVLDQIRDAEMADHRDNYIQHVFSGVDPTNFEQQEGFAKAYLDKYKNVVPGIKSYTPAQLARKWKLLPHRHANYISSIKEDIAAPAPPYKKAA